jgi:hypothetical protein
MRHFSRGRSTRAQLGFLGKSYNLFVNMFIGDFVEIANRFFRFVVVLRERRGSELVTPSGKLLFLIERASRRMCKATEQRVDKGGELAV